MAAFSSDLKILSHVTLRVKLYWPNTVTSR